MLVRVFHKGKHLEILNAPNEHEAIMTAWENHSPINEMGMFTWDIDDLTVEVLNGTPRETGEVTQIDMDKVFEYWNIKEND